MGTDFHFINNESHDGGASLRSRIGGRSTTGQPSPAPSKSKHASPEPPAKKKGGVPKLGGRVSANEVSMRAYDASDHAHEVGTREAHLAAMEAHHRAGHLHQKVSGNKSDPVAAAHFDRAMDHLHTKTSK
jgi:hypothetical protein